MNILLANKAGVKEYAEYIEKEDNKPAVFSGVTRATNALNKAFVAGVPVYEDCNHPGTVYILEDSGIERKFRRYMQDEGACLRAVLPKHIVREPAYYADCRVVYITPIGLGNFKFSDTPDNELEAARQLARRFSFGVISVEANWQWEKVFFCVDVEDGEEFYYFVKLDLETHEAYWRENAEGHHWSHIGDF